MSVGHSPLPQEKQAFMRIEEAKCDIEDGRIYKGDLKKLLKR